MVTLTVPGVLPDPSLRREVVEFPMPTDVVSDDETEATSDSDDDLEGDKWARKLAADGPYVKKLQLTQQVSFVRRADSLAKVKARCLVLDAVDGTHRWRDLYSELRPLYNVVRSTWIRQSNRCRYVRRLQANVRHLESTSDPALTNVKTTLINAEVAARAFHDDMVWERKRAVKTAEAMIQTERLFPIF